MTRVSESISGFYGGVSQQSPEQRREDQVEEMVNCIPSIAEGTMKRPGTEYGGVVNTETGDYEFAKTVMAAKGKTYDVFIRDHPSSPVYIVDEQGTVCSIDYTDNDVLSYLDTTKPKTDLSFVTVFDTVFITNKNVSPQMTTDTKTYNMPIAHAQYPSEQEVTTDNPVQEEFDFTGEVYGVSTSVDVPSKEVLVNLWDDPSTDSSHSLIVKVEGVQEEQVTKSGYYLKADFGETAFYECLKPGLAYKMNPATLPIQIKRTGNTTFEVKSSTWNEREVGDEGTNPLPSFIGTEIVDIKFFKNRLFLLTPGGLVGSKTLEYFDFFATSGLEVLQDDPIDITASGKGTGDMLYMQTYANKLILFGQYQQYSMYSGDNDGVLKATDIVLSDTTSFNCPRYGEVVTIGSSMFFLEKDGKYLNVREYMMQPSFLVEEAANITSHVPFYIPHVEGATVRMFAFPETARLLLHTTAEPKSLYLYEMKWSGDRKVQTAWSKWTFKINIDTLTVSDGAVTLITTYGQNRLRETIHFTNSPDLGTMDVALLDRKVEATNPTYDNSYDRTEWDLPLTLIDGDVIGVDKDTGFKQEGSVNSAGDKFRVPGNQTNKGNLVVGTQYMSFIKLTKWYMKPDRGPAILNPGLTLENFILTYQDTGYFKMKVSQQGRETRETVFTGSILGQSTLGTRELHTGYRKFAIKAKPIDSEITIENNTHLPMKLQMGEYRGTCPTRYNRV